MLEPFLQRVQDAAGSASGIFFHAGATPGKRRGRHETGRRQRHKPRKVCAEARGAPSPLLPRHERAGITAWDSKSSCPGCAALCRALAALRPVLPLARRELRGLIQPARGGRRPGTYPPPREEQQPGETSRPFPRPLLSLSSQPGGRPSPALAAAASLPACTGSGRPAAPPLSPSPWEEGELQQQQQEGRRIHPGTAPALQGHRVLRPHPPGSARSALARTSPSRAAPQGDPDAALAPSPVTVFPTLRHPPRTGLSPPPPRAIPGAAPPLPYFQA